MHYELVFSIFIIFCNWNDADTGTLSQITKALSVN